MILTITPNPTIDRVYYLPEVKPDWVHRATREVATPSGKGVDVSMILHLLGEPTMALGFNAGLTGQQLAGMLDEMGVPHDFVAADGETRTVPVLVDQKTGAEYTITAPTLTANEASLGQLLARLDRYALDAWGLVCAGSLCQGLPVDAYAQILRRARRHGLITLLDVSGDSLRYGLAGLPHILKINQVELAMLDAEFAEMPDAIAATTDVVDLLSAYAVRLQSRLDTLASDAIVISMGKQGAFAVTVEGSYYARALNVPVQVTNGAGDAMDAGILLMRWQGKGWLDALRLGTAAAGAAVMHDGTGGCDPAQVWALLPQVQAERLR